MSSTAPALEADSWWDAAASVPLPASGRTEERWGFLARVARHDLSMARVVEGHLDALAIVAELGRPDAIPEGRAGVWAARPLELRAEPFGSEWVLDGEKPWCSGGRNLDVALVTAIAPDGPRLFVVDPRHPHVIEEAGSWTPLGMAPTDSVTLRFRAVRLSDRAAVGGPDAYTRRPGFGHGGCGVAAVWWGGASAVLDRLAERAASSELLETTDAVLRRHALGTAGIALRASRLLLADAARRIDASPGDIGLAEHLAAETRTAVHDAARLVLDAAARHLGAGPVSHEPGTSARIADLTTYLSQHHAGAGSRLGSDYATPRWRVEWSS